MWWRRGIVVAFGRFGLAAGRGQGIGGIDLGERVWRVLGGGGGLGEERGSSCVWRFVVVMGVGGELSLSLCS